MKTAAPPIVLDQHFSTKVIAEMVASHVTTDDSVTEHDPAGTRGMSADSKHGR